MNLIKFSNLIMIIILLSACSMQSKFNNGVVPNASDQSAVAANALSCLATQPNFQLSTSVDSFALDGGGGITAGFGVNSVLQAIGFGVNYSTGTLDMSMVINSPLYGPTQVGNSTGSAQSQNFNFNINAVVDMVNGSISAWASTGLYALSQSAMASTFSNLANNIPSTTWSTVISASLGSNQFTIPVGSTAGILVGDSFNVFQVNYLWGGSGAPCVNPLQIVQKLGGPIAIATVAQVSYSTAIVTITYPTTADGSTPPILVDLNDRLEIAKLVKSAKGTARTNLKYSLHLGNVSQSNNLLFTDGKTTQNVSMTPFVATQLSNYVVNTLSEYYIR